VQHILRYLRGTLDYALVLGGEASSMRGTCTRSKASFTREQRWTLEGYRNAD
jgi:hypothetical protein